MRKTILLLACFSALAGFSCKGKDGGKPNTPVELTVLNNISSLCLPLEKDHFIVPVTDSAYITDLCDCQVEPNTYFAIDKDSTVHLLKNLLESDAFRMSPLIAVQTQYGDTLGLDYSYRLPAIVSDTLTAETVVRPSGKYLHNNVVYISMRKDSSFLINGFETFPERLTEEIDLIREVYYDRKTIVFTNIDLNAPASLYLQLSNAIGLYLDKTAIEKFGMPYGKLNRSQREELSDAIDFSRTEYFYNSKIIGDDCGCSKD